MAVLIITVTWVAVTYILGEHMPPAKITWLVWPGVLYPLPFVIWLSPGLGLFLIIYSRQSQDTR